MATTEEYIRVKDGYLELRQKLGKGEVSGSGKSLVMFSTRGNIDVEGSEGYRIGVNLYRPKNA